MLCLLLSPLLCLLSVCSVFRDVFVSSLRVDASACVVFQDVQSFLFFPLFVLCVDLLCSFLLESLLVSWGSGLFFGDSFGGVSLVVGLCE